MITLTLLDPVSKHQQWRFKLHAGVKVGRALDNDVVLTSEQVSRYHLQLSPKISDPAQGEWQLQGLGTNGTLLNGKFVTHEDIFHGDLIQLGLSGPVLKFELRSQASLPMEAEIDIRPPSEAGGTQSSVTCAHGHNEPSNRFCIYCGEPLQALERVGPYQVVKTLESKNREASLLVRRLSGEASFYVLKRFQPEVFSQSQAWFEQEVQWLSALNHPGLAKVIDCFCEDPYRYVVMEQVSGLSLEAWVRQEGPVLGNAIASGRPASEGEAALTAIATLLSIGDSLKPLHHHHPPIIHHNLTPSNIVIRHQGQGLTLTNFGSLRTAGLGIPTLVPLTVQSDVYRMGTVLIFLLTGGDPMQYFNVQRSSQHIQWTALPQVPSLLRSIIEKMTHPDPQYRYRTVEEPMEALRNYQQRFS